MKSLINILSFLFLYTSILFAQQTDKTNLISTDDSLKTIINQNPLIQIQIKFDEFELQREFKEIKLSVPIDGDPQTVWLRTSLAISNSDDNDPNFSPHLLSPLQKKYYEDSKFDPIKTILGAAQVGAVGYLAYKHIKKYGFLK